MKTIKLNIDDSIFDKFQWLISHFSEDEINIIIEDNDFDYISKEKLKQLKQISENYKNGIKDDFEEYVVWLNTDLLSRKKL